MATIQLEVADESLLTQLSNACKMLKGVTSVKVKRSNAKEIDVTKSAGYQEAMEDIREGRVTEYSSLEEYFQQMECRDGIQD